MLDSIIKIILKWISSFNWNATWETRLDDEMDKFGGWCEHYEWKEGIVPQINVSLGRKNSGWGNIETSVPLVECMDAVVDEITFNKRARKLFLLLLIGSFKDNPSQLKG